MTCCVAALADMRTTIVLVADRMLSTGTYGGESDIRKSVRVHRDWWVMLSDDPACAVPIIERVKDTIPRGALTADRVQAIIVEAIYDRWKEETEALFLRSRGLDHTTLLEVGRDKLGDQLFREIDSALARYSVAIDFIVAGFDPSGLGHIIGISGDNRDKMIPYDHSLTGYHGVGSGADGAVRMMNYKRVAPSMQARAVLYYSVEGKYFGELAYGVGQDTDVYILRHNKKPIVLPPDWIEKYIINPICLRLAPRELRERDMKRLNRLKRLKRLDRLES